eukprot:5040136-Alexandrium_andersonii.AAC.1
MVAHDLEPYGFPVAIQLHHLRVMVGVDERGDCDCGVGKCTGQKGQEASRDSRWQKEQRQACEGSFS